LRLADIPAWNGDAVIQFANEFGLLGVQVYTDASSHEPPPTKLPDGSEGRKVYPRETLAEWTRQCQALREALWVWEQIRKSGIGDGLRSRLIPRRNRGVVEAWQYTQPVPEHVASKAPNVPQTGRLIRLGEGITFRERDYRTPAMLLLNELINSRT